MHFVLDKDNDNYIPPGCTSLKLTDASKLEFLCIFLQSNTKVTKLNLYLNEIGDEGAKAIAEALKTNSTITTIDLGGNRIKHEGAKAIAEALKINCTITIIDLGDNLISDEGAKALANALKINCTVTEINLNYNQIGVVGAKALADALKTNCTVTTIFLHFNKIGDEGAKALADALKINFIVIKIDLRNNQIRDEGAKKGIENALAANKIFNQKNLHKRCQSIALGLITEIPIYILLDIFEYELVLEIEKKSLFPISIENNRFLRHLERSGSEKRFLNTMNKIRKLIVLKSAVK